jgi:hypothetical protein
MGAAITREDFFFQKKNDGILQFFMLATQLFSISP